MTRGQRSAWQQTVHSTPPDWRLVIGDLATVHRRWVTRAGPRRYPVVGPLLPPELGSAGFFDCAGPPLHSGRAPGDPTHMGTVYLGNEFHAADIPSTPRCRKYIKNNLLRSGRGANEPLPACTLTFTAVERLQADDPHGPTTLGRRPVLIDDVIYCKSSIT